jgi:hypothetical protein
VCCRYCAVGREVAAQHRERAFGVDRVRERADHVVVVDSGAFDVFTQCAAGDGARVEVQMTAQARHQRRQAAGVVEVFHQVRLAARPDVGDHRHLAARGVEVVQRDRATGAA